MIRLIQDKRGVTLTEQLAALLLGAVMITALYEFYRAELFNHLSQEARTATVEDARGALDIMVRELKNAGSWGKAAVAPPEQGGADDPENDADTVCNRFYAAGPTMVHVQMDLNDNRNCADMHESVRYEIGGPTSTCPGVNIRRNGDCLVGNVTIPTGSQLFSYYDGVGADLGNTPSRDAIKRIRIAFNVQVKNPDPRVGGNLTTTLSTSIQLRN